MKHRLGTSGSVILSNPKLYSELFWEGINHIEIGEFPDEDALNKFLEIKKGKEISFGIHCPILRGESKYDLIEKVQYEPSYAWKQLELEAEKMSAVGAEYLLVHFPYFKEEVTCNTDKLIEEGLKKLNSIQERYSIQLVCEPKLGLNRSGVGINYLQNFPIDIWKKYNIKLCIDIGDYMIATGEEILNYLIKWNEFIKVIHLHNAYYEGDEYIWIPVHPTQEQDGSKHRVEKIIRFLAKDEEKIFVFEHTPDTNPSKEFVKEGFKWVRKLIS